MIKMSEKQFEKQFNEEMVKVVLEKMNNVKPLTRLEKLRKIWDCFGLEESKYLLNLLIEEAKTMEAHPNHCQHCPNCGCEAIYIDPGICCEDQHTQCGACGLKYVAKAIVRRV
jgi:hypothetical protein